MTSIAKENGNVTVENTNGGTTTVATNGNGSSYSISSSSSNGNGSTSKAAGLSMWKKQLITKEDPNHIHKTIGILCVLSYIFRIVQIGPNDMGFVTFPKLTMPTIILHLLLNSTSFVFTIPNKRISSGYRIWPEYRLHSFVFLCRSLAVMALYWYEQTFGVSTPNYDMNLLIVIVGMMGADYSSYTQQKYQSSTIRDLDTSETVKFLFSVAQFCGTTNILYGLRYRYSFHMLSVIVIQCNAFLMTIRRKNLVNQSILVSLYGITLIVSMVVCIYEYYRVDHRIVFVTSTFVHITVIQRMVPTIVFPSSYLASVISNKYTVWMTAGLLLRYTRNYFGNMASLYDVQRLFVLTAIPLYILGWYKCYHYRPNRITTSTDKKIEIKKV